MVIEVMKYKTKKKNQTEEWKKDRKSQQSLFQHQSAYVLAYYKSVVEGVE